MNAGELKATVVVKRRSLFGTLRRLPATFKQHYRVLRQGNSRLMSACIAWQMARLLIRVQTKP